MVLKYKWSIHAVLVSTSLNKVKARKIAFDILHKKPVFYRKTKEHHRFDNILATHFSKFRTKVVNSDVSIVFGLLKPEFRHFEGGSITSFFKKGFSKVKELASSGIEKVKDIFTVRNGYNNKATTLIKDYGNYKIRKIVIVRSPIKSYIKYILNVVSFGKFLQALKQTPYDKLFHLSMNIELENGQVITVEKNEVIEIHRTVKSYSNSEMMPVDLKGKVLSFNDLLENGYKNAGSDSAYFHYNAWNNNCQNYIMYLIKGSGLNSPSIQSFVLQDITKLLENTPDFTKKFGYAITTAASIANKISGAGNKRPIYYYY
jgi:hypothetical protein